MIKKYQNHRLQKPQRQNVRKSYKTFTVTRNQKDNKSKATSSGVDPGFLEGGFRCLEEGGRGVLC